MYFLISSFMYLQEITAMEYRVFVQKIILDNKRILFSANSEPAFPWWESVLLQLRTQAHKFMSQSPELMSCFYDFPVVTPWVSNLTGLHRA